MMRNNDIASLSVQRYQEVIDGVVGRVRGEFNQEGIDESVLDEVRALWEAKLVATGVIGEPSNEGQQVIHQQLRVGLPPGVAAMPYAAAAIQQQQQQLLALRHQQLAAAAAAGGAPGVLPMGMPPHMLAQGAAGQPMHMAALQQMAALQAAQAQAAQAHAAQAQAAQAHAVQAQAAQAQAQAQAQAALAAEQKRKLEAGMAEYRDAKQQRTIPQQDGPADDAGEEAGGAGEEATAADDDDDDPLTEDEEGSGDEVDEAAVANVVLGQFEKVQRSKSKWKIVLKDCILTLDNRDYLCRKVTGEMDFS